MASDDLTNLAKHELRAIDRRFAFWIAVGVETAVDSGASAADVDWNLFSWSSLRTALDEWLDGLAPDTREATYRCPVNENLRLCFIAKARAAPGARGYRRMPSLTIADPDPFPPLRFEDGATSSLESLPIETVRELAYGHRRLAVELISHRATWLTLYELMAGLGWSDTRDVDILQLEVTAAALGLVDDIDDERGSFDEGWRAVEGLDVPMFDDPRERGQ